MRRRRILLLFVLVACGSSECRLDPSPSCSYRPGRGVDGPDAGAETFADEITSVRAGDVHACALLSTGEDVFGGAEERPRCWGGNPHVQLSRVGSPEPGELWWYGSWDEETGFFELGAAHGCIFDLDGSDDSPELECWGNDEGGQLGLGPDEMIDGLVSSALFDPALTITDLALGGLHGCIGDSEGVRCFGDERWGQLGTTDPDCCEPMVVPPEAWAGVTFDRVSLAAGTRHSCALLSEGDAAGTLFCWGDDSFGQLGHGALGETMVAPAQVEGVSAVVDVAAGPHHSCALDADGTVWCWGRNERGELGSGDTTSRVTPAPVALDSVAAIFAGGESGLTFGGELDDVTPGAAHSCALDTEGRAFCWGDNSAGQLGVPAGDPALEPVPTHPGERFRDLALGGRFTCGATTGEELLCWGDNTLGQLGRPGESSHEPTPVSVFRESYASAD